MTNLTARLSELFHAMQEELSPSVSVEAGAWRAEFSREMKRRLPKTRAWAFEANKYNYDENVTAVTADGVNYVFSAVTNKVGTTRFLIQEIRKSDGAQYQKISGNNSLLIRNDEDVLYSAPLVMCTSLDAFFIDDNRIREDERACVWIDVEGASREVLEGSLAFLSQVDSILIEVEAIQYWHEQWLDSDVDQFMKARGFTAVARDNEYEHQYNVVYLNNKHLENQKIKDLYTNWEN
jgi:FkbM family methyltransferase